MENKKCYCPIVDREIDAMDCFDAALVFEEMSPLSELPDKEMVSQQKNAP